ncbi:MAG: hypothetical protein E7617_02570 [Ruminococcaceae bacterium]|nr:hypothetical protein [Oscillospiraceae bacterium]
MRFLKEHFDDIVKLYVNQIGVALFAFFLYSAIDIELSISMLLKVLISVFSIGFYFSLLHVVSWEIGAKDKIRIDAGRMEPYPYKGIKLGLLANTPNFIVVGIALLCFIIYMLGGPLGFKSVFAVLNMIFRIFVSMYLGALQGIFSFLSESEDAYYLWQTVGFLVFPLLAALVTHLSYTMGLKEKRIFPTAKK